MSQFHIKGIIFERTDDGSVEMTLTDYTNDVYKFSEYDWASIVAFVSAAGSENIEAARTLHRSAITGQFVTADEAEANPDTTVTEKE